MANRLDRLSNRQSRRLNYRDPYIEIQKKLKRLGKLDMKINGAKHLYSERDRITEEILPYFVQVTHETITIQRVVTLGGQTYRLSTYFYDELKGILRAKVWKATAHETFSIR